MDTEAPANIPIARGLAWASLLVALGQALWTVDNSVLSANGGLALSYLDRAPLAVASAAICALLLGLWKRPGLPAWLAAGLSIGWLAAVSSELPYRASNADFGDGPILLFPYTLVAVATLGAALIGWRHDRPWMPVLWVMTIACTGNGKLFARDLQVAYLLLSAGALVAAASVPLPKQLPRLLRTILWTSLCLLLWIALAAYFGDSASRGWRLVSRVALGILLALAWAGHGRANAERDLLRLALCGTAAAVLMVTLGSLEAARDEGWTRVLASRWRAFGMHPNGSGPLWSFGLVLALAVLAVGRGGWRVLAALLTPLLGLALWHSRSSTSMGALLVGILALIWGLSGRLPRRARTLPALVGLGCVGLLAIWLSPVGAKLQQRFELATHGPSAMGQRYHLWRMATRATAESPVFGQGPNQYYRHARFAEPSFYDGTPQDLHPHNLALALSEGAGLPAMLLFAGLCLLTFELSRRRLRALSNPADRLAPAAISAGWATLLAANSLDLGQSQQTLIPLWSWLTLGALAAPLWEQAPKRPARARWLAGSLAVVWPFMVLLPLLGSLLVVRAQALASRGRTAEAKSFAELAAELQPTDPEPRRLLLQLASQTGSPALVLEAAKQVAALTPGHAPWQLALARAYLAAGQFAEAAATLDLARALDPHGPDRTTGLQLELTLALARGEGQRAQALLLDCLRSQARPWQELKLSRGADGQVLLSLFNAPRTQGVDLSQALAELEAECIALATSQPVTARREALAVVEAWYSLKETRQAADFLTRLRLASGELFASLGYREGLLRIELGERDLPLQLARELEPFDRRMSACMRLEIALAQRDRALGLEVLAELERSGPMFDDTDLFFEQGLLTDHLRAAMQLELQFGNGRQALALLIRLLRDVNAPNARKQEALQAAKQFATAQVDAQSAARALSLALGELDLRVEKGNAIAAIRDLVAELDGLPETRKRTLLESLSGLPHGPATQAFLALEARP